MTVEDWDFGTGTAIKNTDEVEIWVEGVHQVIHHQLGLAVILGPSELAKFTLPDEKSAVEWIEDFLKLPNPMQEPVPEDCHKVWYVELQNSTATKI